MLAFLGRTHLYEGRGVEPVVHGVRMAAAAGCRVVVLTNACGGLRPDLAVGDPVLLSDHLNLTARTPLVGPRFVDLSDVYAARLRALVREIDPSIAEGVYAQFPGPQYETPAEVRMAGVLGADLVGMSTVLEAIAAHAEGCEVLGISLVTNLAAGLGDPLDHEEVLAVGKASATRMGELLAQRRFPQAMSTVLLTGAAGPIGTSLRERLPAFGWTVRGFDRAPHARRRRRRHPLGRPTWTRRSPGSRRSCTWPGSRPRRRGR